MSLFNNLSNNFAFMSEKEKEQYVATISTTFNAYLSALLNIYPSDNSTSTDAYNIELSIKGMILLSGIDLLQRLHESKDNAILKSYEDFRLLKNTLAKEYSKPVSEQRADI